LHIGKCTSLNYLLDTITGETPKREKVRILDRERKRREKEIERKKRE